MGEILKMPKRPAAILKTVRSTGMPPPCESCEFKAQLEYVHSCLGVITQAAKPKEPSCRGK